MLSYIYFIFSIDLIVLSLKSFYVLVLIEGKIKRLYILVSLPTTKILDCSSRSDSVKDVQPIWGMGYQYLNTWVPKMG
jgi:hypothetical protein